MTQVLPTPRSRVDLIDTLRGFALLGLFLVHCAEYFDLFWYKPDVGILHNTIMFLFSGKAYAIFALLFGLSFYIMVDSRSEFGTRNRRLFLWRLTVLLLVGFLHSLLYIGDILQVLAVFGFALVLVGRMGTRAATVLAALLLLQPIMLYQILAAASGLPNAPHPPLHWHMYGEAFEILAHGSFADLVQFNVWQGQITKWLVVIESGRVTQLPGLLIAGLILGRIGFFTNKSLIKKALQFGLPLTCLFSASVFMMIHEINQLADDALWQSGQATWLTVQLLEMYLDVGIVATVLIALSALYTYVHAGRTVMNVLAPYGRMSLTMYVSQAVMCIPLFYGFGLGWYASASQVQALVLWAGLFFVQVNFAHLWLRHFYYGPLEWLWRCATYRTLRVPLKRAGQPIAPPAVEPAP
jgi:uncharacterized protein